MLDAVDPDEHLIQMPAVAGSRPASPQPVGEGLGELPAPAPDRLVGNLNAAFGQHQFDVPEAQAERVVQPDGMADDFGREAVTVMRIRSAFHPATMPYANTSRHLIQLT